jgi:hypothetical protein
MTASDLLTGLPGEELIREGLMDFADGRHTIPACLVAISQPRLRRAGLLPPTSVIRLPPSDSELQLYRLLRESDPDAYSSYNALVRQLVSFEQSLDHRCWRKRSEVRPPISDP